MSQPIYGILFWHPGVSETLLKPQLSHFKQEVITFPLWKSRRERGDMPVRLFPAWAKWAALVHCTVREELAKSSDSCGWMGGMRAESSWEELLSTLP